MILSSALIWFLIGVLFVVVELFIPGFIFIFFTAGAWIAGIAVWITDISITTQIIVFIISSLVLLFSLRKYSMKTFKGSKRADVDDAYSEAKIGKKAIVTKAIPSGQTGEVKLMGSFWMATADDEIAEGESVIIVSQESDDGLTYKVKRG